MSFAFTELQENTGTYISLPLENDTFITDRIQVAKSLFGIIPCNITFEESREEKISRL